MFVFEMYHLELNLLILSLFDFVFMDIEEYSEVKFCFVVLEEN